MSDKKIVERNGVSMDRHSIGNRPAIEVEAAKKAVLNRYRDAQVQPWSEELGYEPDDLFCVFATANGAWRAIGYRKNTEGGAWISAASKLPAPLTEDAQVNHGPFCADGGTCHHKCDSGKCFRQDGCAPLTESGLTDEWKRPSPVGEREGEFWKWWEPIADNYQYGATGAAQAAWNAALASKPSSEGIPERTKRWAVNVGRTGEMMNDVPEGAYVLWSEHESLLSAKDTQLKEANLAIAEWESREAAVCSEEETFEQVISGLRALEQFWVKPFDDERKLREAAEAELSALPAKWSEDSSLETWFPITSEILAKLNVELYALKLSSARIEEDTLRKAAAKVKSERLTLHDGLLLADMTDTEDHSDYGYCRAVRDCEIAILSLIPTSPESQEGK